jgi:hypothetical protein
MKNSPPLSKLSDAELQQRIDRFSRAMLDAEERLQKSGAIEDRCERDQAWISQKALLLEVRRRKRVREEQAANDSEGLGLA